MTETITVYKSEGCGGCRQVIPAIKALAKRKGMRVKVVDVDNCHTKECDDVKVVPTVKIGRREVSLRELASILK